MQTTTFVYLFLCWRCLSVRAQSNTDDDTLVVEVIDQGPVRGYRDGNIFAFKDVPYATAPTGVHKYKAPLPPPRFDGIFDAVERRITCSQWVPLFPNQQEDCLVANILVPDTNATNLPVLVEVHGGAYMGGAGSLATFTSLAKKGDIVVVTLNYRLGPIGFLCLGTVDIPGNAGMKDQVALLRWVKKNIASFRGNPDDVTIAGCSAGGGAVDLLSISPTAKGLFNKIIAGSGACLGFVGLQVDPTQNAQIYAKYLDFTNGDDIGALEEFYKTVPLEVLLSQGHTIMNNRDSTLLFAPCVEPTNGTDEKFLTETPWAILNSGNYTEVPLLYGYANKEGLFYYVVFEPMSKLMNENFSDYLPFDLQFESTEQKEEVANEVKKNYFQDNPIDQTTILGFVNYYSDILFAGPMLRALKIRRSAQKDTVYLFEYSYVDENTPFIGNTTTQGAAHCAQITAIADELTTTATPEYLKMKEVMRESWINFIKTGNPEAADLPYWPPVNNSWSPFMDLKKESTLLETPSAATRVVLWENLYDKYYRNPIPPRFSSGSGCKDGSSLLFVTGFVVNLLLTKYLN